MNILNEHSGFQKKESLFWINILDFLKTHIVLYQKTKKKGEEEGNITWKTRTQEGNINWKTRTQTKRNQELKSLII